jgi:thiamine biosynthesis protein ThiC
MLCYVTPKEHLGLPNKKDVKDGGACARPPFAARFNSSRLGSGEKDSAERKADRRLIFAACVGPTFVP